jgi:RNA polymerase sigma factor (sigma-70 family)
VGADTRPDPRSDAELVGEARLGRKEPMAELLCRHWDTAILLAARVLRSPDLARDAVQEAAVAAMTDLERLRSPDSFGAWFCGIALNVARRWLRQLQAEVPEPFGLDWGLSASPDPALAAEAADTAARVRGAIAALAGGQQHAVRLFYLQGLSHREVAAELGISVGAVKARLHQARAALAPKLVQFKTTTEVDTVTETPAGVGRQEEEETEWVEVCVSAVQRTGDDDPLVRAHVVLLAERGGGRTLPIWIGPAEASVLALALESVETPRPFPYKLAAGLVEAAGAQITEVRITRLLDAIFYACVVVAGPDGPREVDARPSDAVNLALVSGAPIRVNRELFDPSIAGECADWSFAAATADIAAETLQRLAETRRRSHEAAERRARKADGG